MDLAAARDLALALMRQYGVAQSTGGRYLFRFSHAKRIFGWCHYPREGWTASNGYIFLSAPLTLLNGETEVRNTILHEIAHALTPGAHHGPAWRKMAVSIGCDGHRCYDKAVVITPKKPHVGTCPLCKRTVERHRRRYGLACGQCYPKHGAAALFDWSRA